MILSLSFKPVFSALAARKGYLGSLKNTNCLNPIPKDSDLNDIGHGLGIGAHTGLMGKLAQV